MKHLKENPKCAVIFERLGPYHHARLSAAGRLMQIHAIEACGMDAFYAWDKIEGADSFTRITLSTQGTADQKWSREIRGELFKKLDEIRPDVIVVPGWSYIYAISSLVWSLRTGTPAVVMSESTEWDERRTPVKEWVKRQLVSLFSSALVGGQPHASYLHKLGMAKNRIFTGYDAVDNSYFETQADAIRRQAPEIRSRYGLPDEYFLASARFIEKKNLPRLIEAYHLYLQQAKSNTPGSKTWNLVLLGDGPLRESLEAQLSSLDLHGFVQMPGFKQYPDLPAYYGCAKAFIHASTTEQWGLVVNEAMASGLPVLVSNRCGCACDLVHSGVNGFTFDPCNASEIAGLMLKISTPGFPLASMGSASRASIADKGPESFATGLKSAAAIALKNGPEGGSLIQRLLLQGLLYR